MLFKTMLIHFCTLVTKGVSDGEDDYGRDISEDIVLDNIPCLFDRLQEIAINDTNGTDFIFQNMLIFDSSQNLTLATEIRDIKDKKGNPVLLGSFSVTEVMPIYNRSKLHHYEVSVKRM